MLRVPMEKQIKELRSQGKALEPIMNIGKNGVTQGTIDLIDRELEQRQLIKIKLNKTAIEDGGKTERKALAQEICDKTGAKLVELVGNSLVLYRP
jgi:RNA-binding protein